MADSEKKVSSSSDSKEKKSMLDDDIGKEFLSSWKSMSVAENDTMDFGFDTIPSGKKSSGKKSAFDFGKLDDMDFSLDNDFGKFNVDMPDLDFSSSTKKVAKPKDQREGELISKNHKEKDSPFNFSFDFNDMDDFNLDSTLTKRENAPKSNLDRKIAASDKSEVRDSSIDLDVDGRVAAFDEGQNKKVSTSESVLKSDKSVLRGSSIDLDIDGGVAAFDEGQNKKFSASGSALKSDKSVLRGSSTDLDIDGGVAASDEGQNKKLSASGSVLKSDKSVLRGSSIDLDIDGGVAAFDEGQNKKVSASGSLLKPDVETAPGCAENREVSIEKSPSNMFGSHTTSSSPDRNSTLSVNKEDQQVPFSTNTSPAVSSAKETLQISLGQSLGGNDSSKDNVSNVQMEVDSLGSKLHPESVLQHSGNDGMVTNVGSECKTSELKDSDSPYVARDEHTEAESDTASTMPKEKRLETESVAHDSEIEAIPAAVLSPSISKERTDKNGAQDCTAKILAAPESDQVVEKVKLIKERETGVVRSKFFRRSEEPEPQVCQPLPVNEKASILESQGTAVLTLNSKDLSEGESQIGRSTTGDSKSLSRDSDKDESALVGREKNVKNLSKIRVGLTETGNGSASKLPAKSRLLEKESNKVNSVMLGSTKLRKDFNNISGDNPAISTDRTSEPSCQTSENSKTLVPSTGSKILSVGGSTVKKTDLSSFMLLRTSVSSKAQTDASQELNSFKNSQKSVEQKSMELPVKFVSSEAQADASQEFSSLKNAQKSVELPVKFVSRKAQANASQEFSSLKNAEKRVELPEKLVSSKAQTDSSLEFNSLKTSQKSVELPSSKDQTDASQEFSSLKNSQKSVELPVKFVSSMAQTDASRELSSLENLKKSVELPTKFVSAATHPISKTQSNLPGITSLKHKTLEGPTGEAVPLNPHKRLSQSPRESRWAPSLKRKTFEGQTGEAVPLNPHKCLSQSPKKSRYSNEPIKSAVDEQNNTNIVDGNGTTSEQEMPMDVNVKELEISLTMENDGNAEKAEAYAKELENICNMLKKKHEEAKEIMVRAIVNNNSLLMLNHPIFDEKILNVQKLLTKLTMSN